METVRCTLFSLILLVASHDLHADTLWFENGRLVDQATRVMQAMRHAHDYGLRPHDYDLDIPANEIEAVLSGAAPTDLKLRFDAALSSAASRFITHLHVGRIPPESVGFHLPAARPQFDVAAALRQLATRLDVSATLTSFEPAPPPYKRLKQALAHYRALLRQPQLTRLPPLPSRSIVMGDEYVGVLLLQSLLQATGDLVAPPPRSPRSMTFDVVLSEAVQRFQYRHGLDADGVIGPRTFAALTMPFEHRVSQIELTMERWRWLVSTGRPDVVVNVPQFMLFALPGAGDADSEVLEMRVIVGQSYPHTRTPVFTSTITQVVFQPYWDVPAGILRRELLPHIRRDVSYLERHHMEIVSGQGDDALVLAPTSATIAALAAGRLRLRQRPGSDNALGPVKFVMRNPFNVYLHATPQEALFQRTRRTFSHGCIRVSGPAALAAYVLKGAASEWTAAAIEAALNGTKTFRVDLIRPVKVAVFYGTVVATESEGVLFFEDIYGHDRKLQDLLS